MWHTVWCETKLPVEMSHCYWSTERIPDRRAARDWIFSNWDLGSSISPANRKRNENRKHTFCDNGCMSASYVERRPRMITKNKRNQRHTMTRMWLAIVCPGRSGSFRKHIPCEWRFSCLGAMDYKPNRLKPTQNKAYTLVIIGWKRLAKKHIKAIKKVVWVCSSIFILIKFV